MRNIIFLLFLGLTSSRILCAQEAVSTDLYHTYNTGNFRMNKELHQKFDPDNVDYRLLNAAVFFCTNEQRIKFKKKQLQHAQELENAAFLHSQKMGELSFFSHQNDFDENLKGPNERGKHCGIENPYVAENILYYSTTDATELTYLAIAEKMMAMWKSSKPHWKNILSDEGLQLGCGVYFVYEGESGAFYGTQNFQFFENVKVKSK